MNLLALDTSTETMSLAVQRTHHGVSQVWRHTAPGGPQTSAQLIPAIQQLMVQAGLHFGQLTAIVFGCGPGSFTGLRTACSVAQGLALGAHIPVVPVDTLLAVAEEARHQQAPDAPAFKVMALLDARMDEMYGACYFFESGNWSQTMAHSLIQPESLNAGKDCTLAGNVFVPYGARMAAHKGLRVEALPTASALLRLAPALLAGGAAMDAEQALPLYIRDKVAKTTEERASEKAIL
jgi:tRNA threonylcarbamoyladenosine biosynthesis protein TsaB